MVATDLKPLKQIAAFFKVPAGEIGLNDSSLPTRVVNKKSSSGYVNIILDLLRESKSNLMGSSDLERVEVRQWIEYCIVYVLQADSSCLLKILQELNGVLASRTYLVGHKLTVSDLLLYYILQPLMENVAVLDKEKYIHVSRWFDNIQQNPTIRQSNKLIDFNTLYLASIAPARH